jgi:hypothetical protein
MAAKQTMNKENERINPFQPICTNWNRSDKQKPFKKNDGTALTPSLSCSLLQAVEIIIHHPNQFLGESEVLKRKH